MVQCDDDHAAGDLRMLEHAPAERRELARPDLSGRHERRAGDRARQTHDDRRSTPQLHDWKAAAVCVDGELREVALEPGREVVLSKRRARRAARVDIVVAGHDRHARRVEAEVVLDHVAGALELAFEREVGEVAGDDDVVRPGARHLARDGADVRGAVDDLRL